MLFWCICIGYAEFHSHYILVEDPGIPVTLLAHRKIPGGIPELLLSSCTSASAQRSTVPKAINFPQQYKAQENHLELVCCSKSFMKDELLETWEIVRIQMERCDGNCENNCSSPEAEQCYVWVPAAWDREG